MHAFSIALVGYVFTDLLFQFLSLSLETKFCYANLFNTEPSFSFLMPQLAAVGEFVVDSCSLFDVCSVDCACMWNQNNFAGCELPGWQKNL